MRMFNKVAAQPSGVILGVALTSVLMVIAFSLALAAGRVLATHDDPRIVHTCVNSFTGQARIVPGGQEPNCTGNEALVEFAGVAVIDDLDALETRIDDLEREAAEQAERIVELEATTAVLQDELTAHEDRIDELETTVSSLESGLAGHAQRIGELEVESGEQAQRIGELEVESGEQAQRIGELEVESGEQAQRIDVLEEALGGLDQLPDCLTTDGNDVVFAGCNVHIRNGMGGTATTNGTGNLIIGYNENPEERDRSGSHNLVVGHYHGYSSYASFVAGFNNVVSGPHSSISGGAANVAIGLGASVSGGARNQAHANWSSVSGGFDNWSTGDWSSISGGQNNTASGAVSSVNGGQLNEASGQFSSVTGGFQNEASGDFSIAP